MTAGDVHIPSMFVRECAEVLAYPLTLLYDLIIQIPLDTFQYSNMCKRLAQIEAIIQWGRS